MCLSCPPRFQKSLASIMSEYIMAESYIPVVYQLTSRVLPRSRPVCWTVKASPLDGQGHDLTPTWRRSRDGFPTINVRLVG